MAKNNSIRKNRPVKGEGFGNQRFIDPLAFVNENARRPATAWMINPAKEGIDHINVRADSAHPLGRWLNPRSPQAFPMRSFGVFNTIEAYMYFLLANSMRISEPDVVARVDALRYATPVMIVSLAARLPTDLVNAYAHTYRLPSAIYKNIITYVADAYMSKLYVEMQNNNKENVLDTNAAKAILSNKLPYYGYYVNDNNVTTNVSHRATIISAIKLVETRLAGMVEERTRNEASPLRAALLRAGAGKLSTPVEDASVGENGTAQGQIATMMVKYPQFNRGQSTAIGNTAPKLHLQGVPVGAEVLTKFRECHEIELELLCQEQSVTPPQPEANIDSDDSVPTPIEPDDCCSSSAAVAAMDGSFVDDKK